MTPPLREKIELLTVGLLEQHRAEVKNLRRLAESLGLEFGWHYLLDLTWVIGQLGEVKGKRILDAGAGTGILQWRLAEAGATVISTDRSSRANLPLRFRTRYHVSGLRKSDLTPYPQVIRANLSHFDRVAIQARDLAQGPTWKTSSGKVIIYNQDLRSLTDIPNGSLDAVAAISALEHNSPQDLGVVVEELLRVLKPGGMLVASLNASRSEDWWHEASSGWCYSEASLRRWFCLPPELSSNFNRYDEILAEIRANAELRDHLARFYFHSGANGMPWGKWNPQYVPVGVLKIKKG